MDTNTHAEATGATPPRIVDASATITAQIRIEAQAIVIRGPRRVTDQLVVLGRRLEWTPLTRRSAEMGRSLWWIQLSDQPTWLVQVVDEAGELIDMGIEDANDQVLALAGVAKHLLPTAAGPMLLTVMDQAGEILAISTTDNPVKTLAAVTDALLPRHPG
jgi:hypothetical protein